MQSLYLPNNKRCSTQKISEKCVKLCPEQSPPRPYDTHSFALRSTRQMSQRLQPRRMLVVLEVRHFKCQISVDNHYSYYMQTTKLLPSVSTKVITGNSFSHLVCPAICKCAALNFCVWPTYEFPMPFLPLCLFLYSWFIIGV